MARSCSRRPRWVVCRGDHRPRGGHRRFLGCPTCLPTTRPGAPWRADAAHGRPADRTPRVGSEPEPAPAPQPAPAAAPAAAPAPAPSSRGSPSRPSAAGAALVGRAARARARRTALHVGHRLPRPARRHGRGTAPPRGAGGAGSTAGPAAPSARGWAPSECSTSSDRAAIQRDVRRAAHDRLPQPEGRRRQDHQRAGRRLHVRHRPWRRRGRLGQQRDPRHPRHPGAARQPRQHHARAARGPRALQRRLPGADRRPRRVRPLAGRRPLRRPGLRRAPRRHRHDPRAGLHRGPPAAGAVLPR